MTESFTGDIVAAASAPSAAVVAEASPASPPSPTAAGVIPATDAAPISQAAATDSPTIADPGAAAPTVGEPPKEKWPTILENARTKAVQETEAKYGWAASIPEAHRATVAEVFQAADSNPTVLLDLVVQTARQDPAHAHAVRSWFGRMLGTRAQAADPGQTPRSAAVPEPDFQDEQGHTFYSADRIRELTAAIETKLDAKYAAALQPFRTDLATRETRAREARDQHDANAWAEQRYATVSQWPDFTTHEAAIAAALAANPDLDVGDAYIQIAVPHLSQQARTAVVHDLRDKVNAGAINPAAPTSGAQTPPRDFREAFERLPAAAWR